MIVFFIDMRWLTMSRHSLIMNLVLANENEKMANRKKIIDLK